MYCLKVGLQTNVFDWSTCLEYAGTVGSWPDQKISSRLLKSVTDGSNSNWVRSNLKRENMIISPPLPRCDLQYYDMLHFLWFLLVENKVRFPFCLDSTSLSPVNPTRVATTPEAQPNWASGNQNQDIPNQAFSVFITRSENIRVQSICLIFGILH